jgi:ACS family D-galactonate transporter-like MFS transporter
VLSAVKKPSRKPQSDAVRWSIIGLLSVGMVIAYVARVNISVALVMPEVNGLFHLSNGDRGLLNSAFFWSYAFLQIPAGWLVDRYGVKFPYAGGFLIWSLICAATAWAGTFAWLITLRVLLGVAESVVVPASMRWIHFNFGEKERGFAVGLYMTGTKIGPAIGAPLTAWLIGAYDWRIMFVVLGLGSLIWLIPWLMMVRNDDREIEQQTSFVAVPIPMSRLPTNRVIWGTLVGTFCYMYFVYFCMTWMPAYFVEKRHLALASMGLYTFFSFAGMACMAALAGSMADWLIRRGNNPVNVRKTFVIAGFAVASTELIGALSDSTWVALFFAVFSLSGLGLATANYWALTQTLIPGGAIGRMVGLQNCAANIPGIVAPVLSGWLIQRTGDYQSPMQAIWIFLILGIASYVFLVKEKYAPNRGHGEQAAA